MECLRPCAACPKARKPVYGSGPTNARVMGVAEHPGMDEDRKGYAFAGSVGKEIDQLYLPESGLKRDEVYLTNVVKCWPRSDRDMTDNIIEACSGMHLRAELFAIKPELVLLMGATACNLAGVSVEMSHGRPQQVNLFGYEVMAMPMFHPALGMHDYATMDALLADWRVLRTYLETGHVDVPVDAHKSVWYERLTTANQVFDLFDMYNEREEAAIDTEFDPAPHGDVPYCLTVSMQPGTGFLVKAEDRQAVAGFAEVLGHGGTPRRLRKAGQAKSFRERARVLRRVAVHNWMADGPVLDTMGVCLDEDYVDDTMEMAFILCNQPQGLKTLAYRLCSMEMTDFDDLVTPFAVKHWLARVKEYQQDQWDKPEPRMRWTPEKVPVEMDGIVVRYETQMVEKLYKPQSPTTKLKRMMTDYNKSPSHKVFARWFKWDDEEKAPLIAKYGDLPKKSIRMVNDEKALLHYACADADATKRILPVLRRMKKRFRSIYGG